MANSVRKWAELEGPDLLLAWREKAKKTQQEAADLIGCDLAKYNALENGRERPGLDYAVAIAAVTHNKVRPEHWAKPTEARVA